MTNGRGWTLLRAVTVLLIAILTLFGLGSAQAKIVVSGNATIDADNATVTGVVAMFERAEQAVKAHDLETLLSFYSSQYNYHSLKKDDVRKIWKDLFDEYGEIVSTHLFSKIAKVGSGSQTVVEVTCTGHLLGISKTSKLYVPIDSWYEEVHFVVFEDRGWRIRGNVGESPRVLPFGTAPHPLF